MKKLMVTAFALVFTISAVLLGSSILKEEKPNALISLMGPSGAYSTDGSNSWLSSDNIESSFAGGTGTEGDPYLIENANQLARVSYLVNEKHSNSLYYASCHYMLTDNIDLSAYYWTPIGDSISNIFTGNFDGNYKTISGMYIGNPNNNTAASLSSVGLFGNVGSANYATCIIKNLTLECYIYASISNGVQASSEMAVGGIVGYAFSGITLSECNVTGNISTLNNGSAPSDLYATGGLIGIIDTYPYNIGMLNCSNSAKISAKNAAGNMASYSSVGGLIGHINETSNVMNYNIENCFNTGDIEGDFAYSYVFSKAQSVGGLIGYSGSTIYPKGWVNILNCYNSGKISFVASDSQNTTSYAGGIAGYGASVELYNSYSTGDFYMPGDLDSYRLIYAGGLMGYFCEGKISNCYAVGMDLAFSPGTNYAGYLLGDWKSTEVLAYCGKSSFDIRPIGSDSSWHYTYDTIYCFDSEEEMKTQDFVDTLNANRRNLGLHGDWLEWVKTNSFPAFINNSGEEPVYIDFYPNYDEFSDYKIKVRQTSPYYTFPSSEPSRPNYDFSGWYTAGGIKIIEGSIRDENITALYARWEAITFDNSYKFIVNLYEKDGTEINDSATIAKLISLSEWTFGENANVGSIIRPMGDKKTTGYDFLYFKIDGQEVTLSKTAKEFSSFANAQKEITVDAFYTRYFTLSFKKDDNLDLKNNAILSIYIDNSSEPARNFFDELLLQKNTLVKIEITPAPGKIFKIYINGQIYNGQFSLNGNSSISTIVDNASYIDFKLTIDENLPDEYHGLLMPFMEIPKSKLTGLEISIGRILTNRTDIYTLTGWEIYINDLATPLDYTFTDLDHNNNILNLNIYSIVKDLTDVNTLTLKAIWKINIGINIIYSANSSSNMGYAEFIKLGNKIDLKDLQYGDEIEIVLIQKPYYHFVDANGFLNGKKTVTVLGVINETIEFKPNEYAVALDNKNVKKNLDTAKIGDNLILNIDSGLGSDIESYNLKINGKPIDFKYIKLSGKTLVIALDNEFMSQYVGLFDKIDINISYTTRMNGTFIGIISGSGGLFIIIVILIILYLIKLKNKRIQLAKAEKETKLGMARLNAANRISSVRDEG